MLPFVLCLWNTGAVIKCSGSCSQMAALRSSWTWATRVGGVPTGAAVPSWTRKVSSHPFFPPLRCQGEEELTGRENMHSATLHRTVTLLSKALSEWVLLAGNGGQDPGERRESKLCPSASTAGLRVVPTPGAELGTLLGVWTVGRALLVLWLWHRLCQVNHSLSWMLCCIHVCSWRTPSLDEDIQGWRLSCFYSQCASVINHSHDEKLYFAPSFNFSSFSFHQVIQVMLFLARLNSTSEPSCSPPREVLVHCNHIILQSLFCYSLNWLSSSSLSSARCILCLLGHCRSSFLHLFQIFANWAQCHYHTLLFLLQDMFFCSSMTLGPQGGISGHCDRAFPELLLQDGDCQALSLLCSLCLDTVLCPDTYQN